jgi:hypothetical protein
MRGCLPAISSYAFAMDSSLSTSTTNGSTELPEVFSARASSLALFAFSNDRPPSKMWYFCSERSKALTVWNPIPVFAPKLMISVACYSSKRTYP